MDNKIFESLEDMWFEVQREIIRKLEERKEIESFIRLHFAIETVEFLNRTRNRIRDQRHS